MCHWWNQHFSQPSCRSPNFSNMVDPPDRTICDPEIWYLVGVISLTNISLTQTANWCMYVYIYTYIHTYIHTYTYIIRYLLCQGSLWSAQFVHTWEKRVILRSKSARLMAVASSSWMPRARQNLSNSKVKFDPLKMMLNDGWWWFVMIDDDSWWLMMIHDDSWRLMMVNCG